MERENFEEVSFRCILIFIMGTSVIKTIYNPDIVPSEEECVLVNAIKFDVTRVIFDYDENKIYAYVSPI